MRRRAVPIGLALLLAVACGDGEAGSPTPPPSSPPVPSASTPSAAPSGSPTVSPSASRSETPPSPTPTPDGAILVDIPPSTPADEVDVDPLAPDGADVTGRWVARGPSDQLIVAVAGTGTAFARDRAVWRWTPAPSLGGWLGVPLLEYRAARGVLNIDVVVADVTGDTHDDALIFALTGGSGACGTWTVVELSSAGALYRKDMCDGTIDPSPQPVGLLVRESVYRSGDPHCCPSARRETVLTYDHDDGWDVFRRKIVAL